MFWFLPFFTNAPPIADDDGLIVEFSINQGRLSNVRVG